MAWHRGRIIIANNISKVRIIISLLLNNARGIIVLTRDENVVLVGVFFFFFLFQKRSSRTPIILESRVHFAVGGDTCCTPPQHSANRHTERTHTVEPKRVYKPRLSLKTIFSVPSSPSSTVNFHTCYFFCFFFFL